MFIEVTNADNIKFLINITKIEKIREDNTVHDAKTIIDMTYYLYVKESYLEVKQKIEDALCSARFRYSPRDLGEGQSPGDCIC